MASKKGFNNPKLEVGSSKVTFSIKKEKLVERLKEIMKDEGNFEKVRVAAARALYKVEPQETVTYLEGIVNGSPNAGAQVMAMVILMKLQEGTTEED